MGAIFEYPVDDMYKAIDIFGSYMEKASLQFNIELEEYVESVLNYNSSSSLAMFEAASEGLITKCKNAIKMLIFKVKTFIADTKKNIMKYYIDKKIEEKVKKIEEVCKKHKILSKIKINHKDFSAKKKFIRNEKEAIKKLFSKPTNMDKIKLKISDVKDKIKKDENVKKTVTTVGTIFTISFLKGLMEELASQEKAVIADMNGVQIMCDKQTEKLIKEVNRLNKEIEKKGLTVPNVNSSVKESAEDSSKEELQENINFVTQFMQAYTELSIMEIETLRNEMNEYANMINQAENNRLFREEQLRTMNDMQIQDMVQQQIQMSTMFCM